jgi:RNA polymerase sigma factor FliA
MIAATQQAACITRNENRNSYRDQLITEHLHLVTAIATHMKRSVPVHIELDDLIHAGMMGLFDAANKFQSEKEVAFGSYAKHRIRGAILDSLRQQDWASRDLRRRYKQVETLRRELTVKLNREPSDNEIAAELGIDMKRWQALMVDFRSLGAIAAKQQQVEREDQPTQEAACPATMCPDQVFARSEMKHRLSSAVEALPERYKVVVKLYYQRDLSMKEIGGILGVNESRVSQIHKSALGRMQAFFSEKGVHSATAFAN